MKSIKLVKGFFNKTSAKAQVKSEREFAIDNGREIVEIKVMDACQMYISNSWYKSKIREFGSPKPGQLIVVVFYAEAGKAAAANNSRVSINKVIEFIPAVRQSQQVSSGAAKAKTILIELAVRNNTHLLRTGNTIVFRPDYNLSFAS